MTYEEWKKKREESTSDSQSKNSDYNNWLLKSGKLNSVGEEISNRVNAWLQNNNDFLANHNNRIGNNQGKDILDWTYVSDSSDWRSTVAKQHLNFKAESNNIKSLLNQYKDYFSEDYVNSVIDALDGNLEVQGGVLASATEQDKFWSEFETEDAYKSWVAGQRELNAQLSYDLVEGKAEIDRLQNIVDSFGNLNLYAHGSDTASTPRSGAEVYNEQAKAFAQKYGISYEDAKRQLSEKKAYYTLAERAQKAEELASVSKAESENYDPLFEEYATKGEAMGKDPDKWWQNAENNIAHMRNDPQAIESYESAAESSGGAKNTLLDDITYKAAKYMWDDEFKLYNYYLAKDKEEGSNLAEEYLDIIEDTLNYRQGLGIAGELEGKPVLQFLFGVEAGLDQFSSGIEGWFADGYTPASGIQYASGMVREDLDGKGIPVWYNFKEGEWENEILGSSTSQIFYDSITTTSNMLPSILASTASNLLVPGSGAFVGAGLMGASAGGSGKVEMLNLGYSEAQANTYGVMVGAAEAGMEYLLGGITKLGGKLPDGIVGKILTKVDNALARTAIKIGGSMLSEGFEEGLQTVIEPWLKELVTGVDWEDPNIDEVLYSSLLGALSAFGLEGAGVVTGEVGTYLKGKKIRNTSGGVGMLQKIGQSFSADTVAYKIAGKVNAFTDAYTIGRLLNEVGGTISEQNLTDIVNGLTERGIGESDAKVIAKKYQAFLNGEMSLTDEQVKVFENLSPLADVLRKNIIGANTTVYQRTRAYADLMTLAEETANKKKSKTTESKLDSTKPTEASTESVTPEEKANYVSEVERIASEVAGSIPTKTGRSLQEQVNSANETAADRLGVEGKYTSTETGATRLASSGKDVNIVKVESIKDGVMKVKLNDGSIVNAEEIDFSTSDEALVYEAVTNMGVSPTTAWEIIKAYDPKRDISGTIYAMGALEAYTYGHNGVKIEGMSQEGFAALLSPVQKNTAHRLGSIDAMAKVEAQQKTIDKARDRVRNNAKILHKPVAKRNGGVVLEGIESTSLTNYQESQIEVLGKVAEGLGVTFHIFKSDENFKYTMPDGTVRSANGWYNPKTGEIWIDLNSGEVGQSTIIFTAAHELTHFIKHWSPAKFKVFADFLFEQYGKQGETLEQLIRERMETLKKRGRTNGMSLTEIYDLAYEEIVADSTQAFLRDSNAAEKIAALREKDANLANKIKSFLGQMLAKMRKVLADAKILPESKESQIVAEMTDSIQKLYDLWTDALADAGRAYSMLAEVGIGFDSDTDSVHSLRYSPARVDAQGNMVDVVTVGKSEFNIEKIAQLVSKATGRSIEDARRWVNSEVAIANIVMNNPEFLDFEADNRYEAIKKNSDYPQGTVDLSNLCPKREEFTMMFDMLQRKYPNRLFTASDVAAMRSILKDAGITVACGACFVEDRRQLLGEIADTYIGMWKEAVETGQPLQKINAEGKKITLKVTAALAKQYGLTKGADILATDTYIPTQYDLTTYEGFKLLEKNHPIIAMGFNRYNNSRGQQAGRLIEGRAEYNRQVLGWSDAKVKSVNNNGGLRIFSFSDFEVVHLLDLVQVIIDCAARGVKIQGYTKIPSFARLVRGTGIKLNRSLIPKGQTGIKVVDGKQVLDIDTTEGININDENFLDESDNPDIGNIIIGINPTQIGIAMLDDFIDYIIPFHTNKAKDICRKLGIGEWVNYKESQHEKDIGTGKASKHNVNIYTQVINKYHPTNKVEFVNAFLTECRAQKKIPRYAEFLNKEYKADGAYSDEYGSFDYTYREGYHKLLVDFKMFDKEGNILPQGNITPELDNKFMAELLNAEVDKKASYEFPQEVYDRIDEEFGDKFSDRGSSDSAISEAEADTDVLFSLREEAPPKKTVKAYKLMRLVDGKLYPLFIGNNEEVSVGTWYNADSPNLSQLKNLAPGTHLVDMKTGEAMTWDEYAKKYVPTKNGKPARSKPNVDDVHWANDNGYRFMHIEEKAGGKSEGTMLKKYGDTRAYYNWGVNGSSKTESGEGSASLYALRPGWHFGEVPSMHQIGYDGEKGETVRLDNQVWVEVEMSADIDYNAEAEANWSKDIPTHIPTNGYYRFATNPTQKKTKGGDTANDATKADWYVAGAFKVTRILSDSEADSIVENYNKANGKNVPLDYRRNYGRVFNAETMRIEDPVRYSDRDSEGNTLSKEQQEFFKDSEVRDKDGNLLVAYHETPNEMFYEFDATRHKTTTGTSAWGKGFYFSDEKASYYWSGEVGGKNTLKCYLNIKKPFRVGNGENVPKDLRDYILSTGAYKESSQYRKNYLGESATRWYDFLRFAVTNDNPNATLQSLGYDGIIVGDNYEIVIFDSNQAKLTTNKTPTSDPDIRYSDRDYRDNPFVAAVIDTETDYQNRGAWSAKTISDMLKQHPEYDFLRRVYKGDNNALEELRTIVESIDDVNLLENIAYYPVYTYNTDSRKALRKAINAYKKVVNARIQALMEATAQGTDVGMEIREYSLDEIRGMFDSLNTNKDIAKLAEKVFALAQRLDLDIKGLRSIKQQANTQGSSLFEQVAFRVPFFNDKAVSNQKKAGVILHELIHSCTTYAIRAVQHNRTLDESTRRGVLMLENIYNQIKNDPLFKDEYGIKSVGEMVAELSNTEFRDKLQKRNLWQRIIDAIKSLLGIQTKTGTTLEGAEIALNYVLDNFDAWAYDLYVDEYSKANRANDHMLFSDRSTPTSTRSLLAGALETTAQNDIERTKISEYKGKIALIEAEYARLEEIRAELKKLYFPKKGTHRDTARITALRLEENEIANRINVYDRQLLNLEATTALRNVLQREKKMVYDKITSQAKKESADAFLAGQMSQGRKDAMALRRANEALARQMSQGRKDAMALRRANEAALARQRERQAQAIRTIMDRNAESRKKATEGRHETEMRHKIKKVVGDLKALLLNPTKDKHVPIGLQKPVAEALDIINMDTVGAEERIAKLKGDLMKAKTPEEIQEISRKIDRIQLQGEKLAEKLTALKQAYAEIKNSDDPLVRDSHDESIENLIADTADKVGSTSIRDMSLEQLEAVYDMYKAILATVRDANKMRMAEKQETVTANSESVKKEVSAVGGHRNRVLKATKFLKKFGWNMLKPIYAMKLIGSNTFTRLYENVRKGEDTWAVDVNEAKVFFKDTAKKYHYNSWDFKKRYTFKDSAGNSFSLTLEQIMSLYAYSKREQADKHLELGGFIFDDAIEVVEKNKFGIPVTYEVNDANPYRLKKEDLGKIISILDTNALKDVKGFVDEMQAYLSDVMGAKGNEVSLAMYDIKLFKEQNYFPLKTSKYFREFDPEKSGTPRIKNSGFSKKTNPQAGNPIILSNFMDVWANHVNDMSMYHAFVLPLEDFMRVYNYSSTAGGYDSVQQYIKNAYGAQANTYIETLMNDLNGGARSDPATDLIGKAMSLFKKAATFLSASVVIQQPSAIARAMAYIDAKYFVDKPEATKHSETWAEVKKYAPVAIIKEMGYFDTNMGRSTVDWIKEEKTWRDKVDDIASKAPALADELAWCAIWKAVKREIADSTNLKVGSEEFLKMAGKRFTEVVTKTQVYDSVLSRSALMRSKDTGAKMITAFMAEPTTSLNMVVDAIIEGKRGNKKFAWKAVGAVASSIILNSILVSLVTAARDDDEDETYIEKYLESLTAELLDGFNPLTYIPLIKDIWSIMQGYDVERSDMSIWSDLWASVENLFSDNKSGFEKTEGIVGSIASIFGIPAKNLMRDARGMYNLATTLLSGTPTTKAGVGEAIGGAFKSSIPLYNRIERWVGADKSKSDNLYDAIISGDQNHIDRVKAQYKDDKAIESAIKQGLRENDSRIKEAAQARLDGDIDEYKRIAKAIIAEGHFSQDTVVAAINAEMTAIKKGEATEEEVDTIEKVTSIYSASDVNAAFESGDSEMALEVIDELFNTKVENYLAEAKRDAEKEGKRFNERTARKEAETKAKSSIRSSMTSYWKPLYKEAYKSGNTAEKERIERILKASGLYGSASEVIKTCREWRTEK